MRSRLFTNLTPRRKLALVFAGGWILLAFLAPFVLSGNPVSWSPGLVTMLCAFNGFASAVMLVEFIRAYRSRFAEMNDEQHFFMVLCVWGAFFVLTAIGYLLIVRAS